MQGVTRMHLPEAEYETLSNIYEIYKQISYMLGEHQWFTGGSNINNNVSHLTLKYAGVKCADLFNDLCQIYYNLCQFLV